MTRLLGVVVLVVVGSQPVRAQVVLSGGTFSYSQDFDSLPTSNTGGTATTSTFSNNATIPGFYSSQTTLRANNGQDGAGGLYSYGTASATPNDRALGSLASGSAVPNYAVVFRNDNAEALSEVRIQFTGEQWRRGGGSNTITFDYRQSGTAITDSTTGTYTGVSALNITFLGGANTNTDGNSAVNQSVKDFTFTLATPLATGDYVSFRFSDLNDAGNDAGIAIDNMTVTFTPVPEPATVLGLSAGALGLLRLRRRLF